ncbi:hypothetical protein HK100_006857 [Physocladia obscura]|uniref:Methyltransferase domain-containing protein n=1 Tax=Physocladia obscura TaxID=109957 RepID=A0AAD5XHC1_9FUNG|nr:hypothetical protein HK100_006857 [Physocladia obscura]
MGPNVSRAVRANFSRTSKNVTLESATITSNESPDSPDTTIRLVTSLSDNDLTREYHGVEDSEYFLPSDVDEQDRLELQFLIMTVNSITCYDTCSKGQFFKLSFVCLVTLNSFKRRDIVRNDIKEFLAITPNCKILDVGCANGWWLDSIGKIYPTAELHGVDLAPSVIETAEKFLPKGKFFAGNVTSGLPYEDNTFDFVHQRYLVVGLQKSQFPGVIRELMRVTKPGGWIELVELDMTFSRCGPIFQNYLDKLAEVMAPREFDVLAGTNLLSYVALAAQKTRFRVKKITKAIVSMPINWGGPLGDMVATDFKQAIYNVEDIMYKPLGIAREEFKSEADKMIDESKDYKAFSNTHAVSFQIEKK